jgi:hypothetical protein
VVGGTVHRNRHDTRADETGFLEENLEIGIVEPAAELDDGNALTGAIQARALKLGGKVVALCEFRGDNEPSTVPGRGDLCRGRVSKPKIRVITCSKRAGMKTSPRRPRYVPLE